MYTYITVDCVSIVCILILMKDTKGVRQVLEELIGQAIGEASICWSETPKGVFESERAVKLTDKTVATLQEIMLGMPDTTNVTRVEVIDQDGRSYVNWDDSNQVLLELQDNNRTLKIFIGRVEQNIRGGFNNG